MVAKQNNWSKIMALRLIGAMLVFGGVAVAALYVWSSNNTKTASPAASSASSPAEVLKEGDAVPSSSSEQSTTKTYTDEFTSFTYPASWKVSKQYTFTDFYAAHAIEIKAPLDASLAAADPSQKQLFLNASITIFRDGRFTEGCAGCGKVFAVTPVTVAGSKANLVIAESGTPDKPAIIDLTREAVAVGAASYLPNGARIGTDFNVRVLASYNSDQISLIAFNNAKDIQNSAQYKQLLDLVTSVQIKKDRLPQ